MTASRTNRAMKRRMEEFKGRCRQLGLKVTPQRMAVYQVLAESKDHPSAEMLCRKVKKLIPDISLDTVNRSLLKFSETGLAFTVEGSGDVRRYDGNMETHHHFKCMKCKKIFDFHHKPFGQIKVPAAIARKFKVLRKAVLLEGLCDHCYKNSKS